MQVPYKTKRRLKRWLFILAACFLLALGIARGQGGWTNDEPIWEYEDESPQIPADVRLKMHALDQAYHLAGDYHNERFQREFLLREPYNTQFGDRWAVFAARWVGFNDYLARFQRSVWVNAGAVTAGSKVVNIEHTQLAGRTRAVLSKIIDTARDLTSYLEDDIVVSKWEIFIARLVTLEDTLKDFD